MKPHAKSSRYMSLVRRGEYIDDLLEHFSDLKCEAIASLICQVRDSDAAARLSIVH